MINKIFNIKKVKIGDKYLTSSGAITFFNKDKIISFGYAFTVDGTNRNKFYTENGICSDLDFSIIRKLTKDKDPEYWL